MKINGDLINGWLFGRGLQRTHFSEGLAKKDLKGKVDAENDFKKKFGVSFLSGLEGYDDRSRVKR